MKVFEAICLRNWSVEGAEGDKLELKRGTTYIVSEPHRRRSVPDEHVVMVFSRFWERAPLSIFESPATWQELGKPGPVAELQRFVANMVKRKR